MKIEKGYFDIITGYEPKYKCKIKFIQKILIKLFGYKIVTESKKSIKIEVTLEDYFQTINEGKGEIDITKPISFHYDKEQKRY